MLVTFKSAASGDLVMFEKNGKELLALLGKDPGATRGVVTVEQLPSAIAALRTAMAEEKASQAKQVTEEIEGEVKLSQRAMPLLDMLERSLQEREPATWGV